MKKLYILLLMVLFTGYVFGQSLNRGNTRELKNSGHYQNLQKGKAACDKPLIYNDYVTKNKSTIASRWYNYASKVQELEGPEGNLLHMGILFPDTTALIQYSDGTASPWLHSMAVALYPLSEVFDSDTELNLNKDNMINVDSIIMFGYYRRHINNDDIVDTLIVEVLQADRWYTSFVPSEAITTNYDTDTLKFCVLNYDADVNYVDPRPDEYTTPKWTYKIPLTKQSEADTTDNGINVVLIECKAENEVNHKAPEFTNVFRGVVMTARFKPGYTWLPNESIINTELNEFNLLSYEEQGENTYPKYRSKKDWNSSQVVPKWALFDQANSWYGTYVPSYGFVQGYVYENHFVSFHIQTNNVGITENAEKTISLSQNVPNPADNSTMITYELKKANDVNFVITDLTGKKVMELNEGKQVAGVHNVTVNTGILSNGLYYYTLNAGSTSLTRKMIVNK